MFRALLHHLGRAVDSNGREIFAQGDCFSETLSEVEELDRRINDLNARLTDVVDRLRKLERAQADSDQSWLDKVDDDR